MHSSFEKLTLLKNKIKEIVDEKQLKNDPKIIVVTKTFSLNKITPLLNSGHLHFGENKIQEAESKWLEAKKRYKSVQLHMIGKLQTNKAKKAIKLFDYIHSLDNKKLALKLYQHEKELNKKCKFFIQVNLAEEDQKSGIMLNSLSDFLDYGFDIKQIDTVNVEAYVYHLQVDDDVAICYIYSGDTNCILDTKDKNLIED